MVAPYAGTKPVPAERAGTTIFIPVTNPIESTFATVRHRTIRSKGCLSNKTALAMVFKLVEGAQKSWRRIDGHNQLPKLIQGVKFADGIEIVGNSAAPQAQAAA
jgi:putative transposase